MFSNELSLLCSTSSILGGPLGVEPRGPQRILLDMMSYHSLLTRLACRSVGIFYRVTDTSLQATQLVIPSAVFI